MFSSFSHHSMCLHFNTRLLLIICRLQPQSCQVTGQLVFLYKHIFINIAFGLNTDIPSITSFNDLNIHAALDIWTVDINIFSFYYK
jgi:hypothetical protein